MNKDLQLGEVGLTEWRMQMGGVNRTVPAIRKLNLSVNRIGRFYENYLRDVTNLDLSSLNVNIGSNGLV